MRPDIDKVVVERPRYGGGVRRPKGIRKRERLAMADLASAREGMRRRWTSWQKMLNEHLGPLRRYLRSQVGRPWNKVHSEISRHLRLASAVQSHVLDHLWDYVAVKVRLVDGEICDPAGVPLVRSAWQHRCPLFYVCPKSGLLKVVPRPGRKRQAPSPREFLAIDELRHWRKVDGIWYEIESQLRPNRGPMVIGTSVLGASQRSHGAVQLVIRKRQLSKREVRRAERPS
jgi:hypothetical protein